MRSASELGWRARRAGEGVVVVDFSSENRRLDWVEGGLEEVVGRGMVG